MTGLGLGWDIVLIGAGIFILLYLFGVREGNRDGKKAINILTKIEAVYEKYITQKITKTIIATDSLDLDVQEIINDIMTILKPDINGIIYQINASGYTNINIKHESPYFSNIVSLIQQYFDTSQSNEEKKLTQEEIDHMYEGFRIAIAADIKKRMLEY